MNIQLVACCLICFALLYLKVRIFICIAFNPIPIEWVPIFAISPVVLLGTPVLRSKFIHPLLSNTNQIVFVAKMQFSNCAKSAK